MQTALPEKLNGTPLSLSGQLQVDKIVGVILNYECLRLLHLEDTQPLCFVFKESYPAGAGCCLAHEDLNRFDQKNKNKKSIPCLHYCCCLFSSFKCRSAHMHHFHSLGQDQSTVSVPYSIEN